MTWIDHKDDFDTSGGRFKKKESGVRSQESGVRSQESGVRSQEAGARSQESGGRSQEPGVRSQEPGVRSQEAGVRSQESGVRSQESGGKQVLTVAETAWELGVDAQTVRKYLALDPDDDAPIPFDAWFRLPGGHIRIYRWVLLKIRF